MKQEERDLCWLPMSFVSRTRITHKTKTVLKTSKFRPEIWVYLGVRTCEVFLCFVAIVRVRVYYVDFFVFFVLRHW